MYQCASRQANLLYTEATHRSKPINVAPTYPRGMYIMFVYIISYYNILHPKFHIIYQYVCFPQMINHYRHSL